MLQASRVFQPLRLRDICLDILNQYRHGLGDLGFIDPEAVRRILGGVTSASQLAGIEDATRHGSGYDVSWYTWHFWHQLYLQDYGPIRDYNDVPPLRGEAPLDYTPPAYNYQAADYRAFYEAKQKFVQDRMARACAAVKRATQKETNDNGKKRILYTEKMPPPKRSRTVPVDPRAVSSTGKTTIAGQARTKVLSSILASKKSSSSSGHYSSNSSKSLASSTHGPNGFKRPVNPSMVPKPLAAFKKAAPLEPKPSSLGAPGGVSRPQQQQQQQGGATPPPSLAARRGLGLLDKPAVLQNGKAASAAGACSGGGGGQSGAAVLKGLGLVQKPKTSTGGLLGKPPAL